MKKEVSKKTKENIENNTKKETLYPISDLIQNSEKLTGYKSFIAIGALNGCDKIEMTKNEFKELVNNFLKKGVN